MNIKISKKLIDYATLDPLLRLPENQYLSAPHVVEKYALDVRPITVSNRRRDLGLEWDRYQGKPRPEKKRSHSVLKLTRCLCPKCRRSYHAQAHYTGRLPYRRYCDNCKNKIVECQWPELPLPAVPHRIAMAV